MPLSPHLTDGTYQMALSASIASSLHDLLWMRGSKVGINSAKAFSSPGAILRAKESRVFRPDCTLSSFPVRHNPTVSRIFKMDKDEEMRTSSESLSTRSASKSNVPDLSWSGCQRIFRAEFFVQRSPSYPQSPSAGLSHATQTRLRV